VRVRQGLIATVVALLVAAPVAHARDANVSSFDGTKIVLSFFPAEGLKGGDRAPTVLIGHGWGQSRETDQNAAGAEPFGLVGPGPFRKAGYNVLTWDARGFGQSGGTVEVDSPDYEARDVQALIDFVAQQPEALLDGAGDPRVGMSGASYGGGIQFVTAARDSRVDVIAPDIAWNSLITSLFKDGAVKSGWGTILFGAGSASGNLDPHIQSSYASGLATGTTSADDLAWFDARGPRQLLARVRIPTFIVQGTADTLFTLQESIDNYDALRANGIPLKMMWFCGGHGVCLTGQGDAGRLQGAVLAWFDRHLKRDTSVDSGPRFEWIADDARWRTSSVFPLPVAGTLAGDGAGTLPIAQTTDSGQPQIAATPAANALDVAIASPSGNAQVLGAPRLSLTYSGSAGPSPSTHVYAQVVDTRSGRVLGNQATPIPVTLDGAVHSIDRPLEPVAAAATADSRYQLQIAAYSGLYGPQRAAGAVTFSRVHVDLPVVDDRAVTASAPPGAAEGGKAAPRLRIGALRHRIAGRRRLRVWVSGTQPMVGVVVTVRDRRGRPVGRSRATVVSRRSRVTIRLRRPLRAGRYTVGASGSGSVSGQKASAKRGFRLRR
jgi:ABC-2 type transport system ATP-binding protein